MALRNLTVPEQGRKIVRRRAAKKAQHFPLRKCDQVLGVHLIYKIAICLLYILVCVRVGVGASGGHEQQPLPEGFLARSTPDWP